MTEQYTTDALGYYQILGVRFDAPDAEIKQNYRERAKLWHPDHNSGIEATEKFQKLSVAYDVLKEQESRLVYDLLSQAYIAKDFPDMFGLKVYADRHGQQNPFLRVFSLCKVTGKFVTSSSRCEDEICNPKEAMPLLLQTSLHNWLLGWWGLSAFAQNIKAIKANFANVTRNRQKNLTLLIHNALAYWQEGKKENAFISAKQALIYANNYQQNLLKKLIYLLGGEKVVAAQRFNFKLLKYAQLSVPAFLFLAILGSGAAKVVTETELWAFFATQKEIAYHQEVRFESGRSTFDDMVVSKVLSYPVNTESVDMLYHLKNAAKVMYGPSDDFAVMAELRGQTTVRLTGKTPDDAWARVMLDNGEMGFVRLDNLSKDVGRDIPAGSKIYTGPGSLQGDAQKLKEEAASALPIN